MKVTHIELDNFQSYDTETIDFEDGVSLLHGDNGAGKSTVLRAIFAGLFQTDMSRHASSDFDSIGELVRKGEDEGGVVLTFEVGGNEYELTWTISVDDPDEDNPTGSTKECVLEGAALSNPVDGVTSVRDAIQEDILGMDAKAFTNSVYVQQNEVMKLITADEGERKEIFDDLLGLSQLDDYIDRTVELRREAKAKRDEAAAQRDEVQNQLDEQYPARDELVERQQELADDLHDAEAERDRLAERVSTLEDERDAVQERIDNYDDLEDERDELTAAIEDLNGKIADAEDRISELDDEIDDHEKAKWQVRRELNQLDDEVDEYDLTDADTVEAAESTLSDKHVEKSREETEAEQRLQSAKQDRQDAEDDVSDLETTLSNLHDQEATAEEAVEDARSEQTDAENAVADAEDERDECVQAFLDDAPDTITQETRATVETHISALDEKREEARNEVTRLDAEKDAAEKEVERLANDIADVKAEREDALESLPKEVREAEADGDESVVETRIAAAQDAAADLDVVGEVTITPDNLETLRDETFPEMRAELDATYAETIDTYADLAGQERHLEARLDEYQTIKQSGECPVCGEDVADENDHHEDERTRVADELGEVQCELVDVRNKRERLEAERETLATVRDRVAEAILVRSLAEYDAELDRLREEKQAAEARVDELAADIQDAKERADEYAEQVETGRNEVLTAFDRVDERRAELEDAEDAVEEAEAALDDVQADIRETEDDLEAAREHAAEMDDHVEAMEAELEAARDAVEAVKSDLDTVQEAADQHDALADHEQAIENKQSEQANKQSVLETLRERRGEKQSRLDEVEDELDSADLDDLRDEKQELESDLADAKQERDDAQQRVDSLNGDLAKVENKLESRDALAERVDALDAKMREANSYVEEMNDLIETYEDVKLRLRKENIKLINAYANEVFRELYHSASYERIILNEDYTITLLKSDGSRISPKLSSGGESAIVNIALRAGVYRTIAERNQTASSGLPPFILDEPTTFLDDGHIQELEQVIENIKDWDVSQVIVVSHDEALIDSADYEYTVTKDSTTDTSTCEQRNAGAAST